MKILESHTELQKQCLQQSSKVKTQMDFDISGQPPYQSHLDFTVVSFLKVLPSISISLHSKNAKSRTVFSNFMVQGTVGTIMSDNGEFFNVVVIPSDQVPENYQMGNVIFSPKRGKFHYFDGNTIFPMIFEIFLFRNLGDKNGFHAITIVCCSSSYSTSFCW